MKEWLLSVHGHWADKMLAGTKTVELRTRLLNFAPGDRLWLYSTSPVAAVRGYCWVHGTDVCEIERLRERYAVPACVPPAVFDRYFRGRRKGCAILICDPMRLPQAVPLHALTAVSGKLVIPQYARLLKPWERILHVLRERPGYASDCPCILNLRDCDYCCCDHGDRCWMGCKSCARGRRT